MMKNAYRNPLTHLAALVLSLMLALPCMPAFAAEDPLAVVLSWTDGEGQNVSVQAQRLAYDGFANYLWAYVPADAPLDAITLNVTDASGAFARFDPENGSVLTGLKDAGSSVHAEPVFITAYDWDDRAAETYYLYVSTYAETPDQPAFGAAGISVRYVDEATGSDIGGDYVQAALGRATQVTAPDFDGYTLKSDRTRTVNVDHMGVADTYEVVFYYQADVVYTAPSVPVTCYDENGNLLGSWNQDTTLDDVTTVTAPSFDGYELNDASEKYINVSAEGVADVSEVVFNYKTIIVYIAPSIPVNCYDENGNLLGSWNQDTTLGDVTTVTAPQFEGYELNDAGEKYINVSAEGVADVSEVTFNYKKSIVYTAPVIPVYGYDENGTLIYQGEQQTVLNDMTAVSAPVVDGYELNDAAEKYISVDEKGNADVSEVTFAYKSIVYTAPVIPVYGYDENGTLIYQGEQQTVLNDMTAVSAPVVDGYELNDAAEKYISVDEKGNAEVGEVTFNYKTIIVYTAPVIPVYGYDENGNLIYQGEQQTVLNDMTAVSAPVVDGYELNDAAEKYISVDEKGNAEVGEVTFNYKTVVVYTAPSIPVNCYDENGNLMYTWNQDTTLGDVTTVTAPQFEGYELNDAGEKYINVSAEGVADVSEVTFNYKKSIVYTAPVIPVYGYDENGTLIYQGEQQTVLNDMTAVSAPVVDGYELNDAGEKYINVSAEGVADVSEVTFTYKALVYTAPVVTIYCADRATGEVIHTETVPTSLASTNRINAPEMADWRISGSAEDYVNVDEKGNADKTEVTFYYDAIVYEAPVITVICLDEATGAEIHRTTQTAAVDQVTTVYAPVVEKYVIVADGVDQVTVDHQGNADKTEVTFYYKAITNPTVTVRYVNEENGKDIRTAEVLECPVGTSIQVQAANIEGYTSPAENTVTVTADMDGNITPEEVVFAYQKVPVVAMVNITYRNLDKDNEVLYSTTQLFNEGTHTITVDTTMVDMSVYELADTDIKQVNVNAIGVTTPGEVVFLFREKVEGAVQVLYCDESGNQVASSQRVECYEGNNSIVADPIDLKEGYELIGENVQAVKLDENGVLTPEKVVFYYRLQVTPAPEVTASPEPELPYTVKEMDTYGYPVGDDINFRSWPTTKENNVIRTVDRTDLAHITGMFTAEDKKEWYVVELVATHEKGYLRADRVRVLTQDEINALMGYTAEPTPEATPAPTQVPDNVAIDCWGVTNDSVRFREGPSTKDGVISSLKKNTSVWVLRAETHNSERWYYVNINGTVGYVMASFVDMLSREESDQYQQALSTPVPTQGPEPTRMPTTEVTTAPTPDGTPTAEPTATVAPTATPALYRGYALTLDDTALRTGVSQTDDNVIEVVKGDQLVLISAQTYVDGVCWDNVEVISSGSIGFMPDGRLLHINNEQAKYYLENLAPTPSPSPVPTATPAPVSGYAITLGDGVMLRAFADTNASIMKVLPVDTVVMVYEQEYVDGEAWHIVNSNEYWGYIRYDQVRMMTEEEVIAYLDSFKTATPVPENSPTPVPVTDESASSYGYVNTDKVNMRDSASTAGNRIRLLDKYAFALVLGTEVDANGEVWYRISQAGKEGYVMGNFFTVLSIGELNDFLTSDEYMNSGSNDTGSNGSGKDNLQSVEDYNTGVWQNPALSPSYEPFNPFATQTPNPEMVPTQAPNTDEPREDLVGKKVKIANVDAKMYSLPSLMSNEITQSFTEDTVMTVLDTLTNGQGEWLQVELGITKAYVLRDDVKVADAEATPEIQEIGPVTQPDDNAPTSRNATGIILLSAAAVLGGGAGYAYYIYRKNERRRQAVREQQLRQQAQRNAQQPQTRAAQNNPSMPNARPYGTQQRPGATYMPPQGNGKTNAQVPPAAYRAPQGQQQNAPRQVTENTVVFKPQDMQASAQDMGATQQFRPVQNVQQPSAPAAQEAPATKAPENASGQTTRVRRSDRYKNNGGNA